MNDKQLELNANMYGEMIEMHNTYPWFDLKHFKALLKNEYKFLFIMLNRDLFILIWKPE